MEASRDRLACMQGLWCQRLALFACVIFVAVVAGWSRWSCLHAEFTYDDQVTVQNNPVVLLQTPSSAVWHKDYWGTDISNRYSHGSYRPLTTLTLARSTQAAQDYGLREGSQPAPPWCYRIVNIWGHAVNAGLVVLLLRALLGEGLAIPLVAALAFAVHPVQTEAICSISSRADVLATLCMLVALWGQVVLDDFWAAILLGIAGTLCKETGIVTFGVLAVHAVLVAIAKRPPASLLGWLRTAVVPAAPYAAAAVAMFGVRLYIQGYRIPSFGAVDNTMVGLTGLPRVLTGFHLFARHVGFLIAPYPLAPDRSYLSVLPLLSIQDYRNLTTVVCLGLAARVAGNAAWGVAQSARSAATAASAAAAAAASEHPQGAGPADSASDAAIRAAATAEGAHSNNENGEDVPVMTLNSSSVALLGMAVALLPLLPGSNLLFEVGFTLAERTVYPATAGFALLVAVALQWALGTTTGATGPVRPRLSVLAIASVAAALFAGAMSLNVEQAKIWQTPESFWQAEVAVNLNNAKGWFSLGHIQEQRGNHTAAQAHFMRALGIMQNLREDYPHLPPGDTVYPDAAIHLSNSYILHNGSWDRALSTLHNVAAYVQYDCTCCNETAPDLYEGTYRCVHSGSPYRLHPAFTLHHDRIGMYAIIALNAAILRMDHGVDNNRSCVDPGAIFAHSTAPKTEAEFLASFHKLSHCQLLLQAAGAMYDVPPHRRLPALIPSLAKYLTRADFFASAATWWSLAVDWSIEAGGRGAAAAWASAKLWAAEAVKLTSLDTGRCIAADVAADSEEDALPADDGREHTAVVAALPPDVCFNVLPEPLRGVQPSPPEHVPDLAMTAIRSAVEAAMSAFIAAQRSAHIARVRTNCSCTAASHDVGGFQVPKRICAARPIADPLYFASMLKQRWVTDTWQHGRTHTITLDGITGFPQFMTLSAALQHLFHATTFLTSLGHPPLIVGNADANTPHSQAWRAVSNAWAKLRTACSAEAPAAVP